MKQYIKTAARGLLLVPALVLGFGFVMPVAANNCPRGSEAIDGGITAGVECAAPSTDSRPLLGPDGIFQDVVNLLLLIVGLVAVIMLIIGGIRYVVSNGDQNAVTGAKNTILYAIIGIVVAVLAYAIVNFIVTQLVES